VNARRYTIVIADRTTGVVRRFTFSLRPTLAAVALLFSLPLLMGLGARWSALAEVSGLRATVDMLQQQNDSFRSMTAELTGQVESVRDAVGELSAKAPLDPDSQRALDRLPAAVRAKALGGGTSDSTPISNSSLSPPISNSSLSPSIPSPEDTFGTLRVLLSRLGSRLEEAQVDVVHRTELVNAMPSIWPARGPLSATFGERNDPFNGGPAIHTGIDISGDRGTPVYATGDGTVKGAGWNGDYGNMISIDHGYGMVTRYAHLSGFSVQAGEKVKRGEIVGFIGSTGRATGPHLHYELLMNGRLTDPVRLLTSARKP
jgi:murein DD-endopeptidase MepM/ murein hydrolase activator NlpD